MGTNDFWRLSRLSDQELELDLSSLLTRGARMEAHIVAHLAEIEERRLHLKAAYSSLFDYCLRRLRLSESEAFHRINAARLASKFPLIFQLLEARTIHLSALRLLRDHLTDQNHRALLAAAAGKSKKEVEVLVATLAPRRDVPSGIRKLPERRRAALELLGVAAVSHAAPASAPKSPISPSPSPAPAPAPVLARRAASETAPAASDQASWLHGSQHRYRLQLTATQELKDKLERARDLMSHANPNGELSLIVEKALDLLLERLEKQRFAQTKRPRAARKISRKTERPHTELATALAQPRSPAAHQCAAQPPTSTAQPERIPQPLAQVRRREHIPNKIRRAIVARDGARCTYIDGAGHRCPARAFLQLHHEHAHALGGPSTLENLRIVCGAHNRLLAEQDFGRAHQRLFTEPRARAGPANAPA